MGGEGSLEPHLEPETAALKKQVRAGFSTRTAQPSAGNDGGCVRVECSSVVDLTTAKEDPGMLTVQLTEPYDNGSWVFLRSRS